MNPLQKNTLNFATQTLGFDDCRITSADAKDLLQHSQEWLNEGKYADMEYLKRHAIFKENPDLLLPGVRSAIVVTKSYKNTSEQHLKGRFKIARYAVGQDYHVVIQGKLQQLANFIEQKNPESKCYYGVDSRPIAERSYALKSGIGFLGKNTMIIKPGKGSYFFIGVILTTQEFPMDKPLSWNCGNCRLCLDACPTQALIGNYQMDAAKCISYQTIEQKTPMSEQQIKDAQGWIYGCDICQEVCPYNHDRIPLTDWMEFMPESGVGFDFFEKNSEITPASIPRDTALYRSRQRIIPNIRMARQA